MGDDQVVGCTSIFCTHQTSLFSFSFISSDTPLKDVTVLMLPLVLIESYVLYER